MHNQCTLQQHLQPCCQTRLHCAVAAPRKAPGEIFDTYLGMLYPTEDYKVYGYISNTRIKFILVVDETPQKEDEMRMVRVGVSTVALLY